MTKYILHGGGVSKECEENKKFFLETVKNLHNNAQILVVCFAKPKESWEEKLLAVKNSFINVAPDKNLNFLLASDDLDEFKQQLGESDVIYILGGDASLLKETLTLIPDLEKLWAGKIVAGSSAGALVLSKYYYDGDYDSYNSGLGILPIKIICHWGEERKDKLGMLQKFSDALPTCTLREQEFVIFEK